MKNFILLSALSIAGITLSFNSAQSAHFDSQCQCYNDPVVYSNMSEEQCEAHCSVRGGVASYTSRYISDWHRYY